MYETLKNSATILDFLFISFSPSKREFSYPEMIPLFCKNCLMVLQMNFSLLDVGDNYF